MSSISDTAQRNTAGAEDGSTRPVQAAIAARRTARRFGPESVARETIQRLLRSAVQAPNHRRTLPWRFFVLDRRGPVRTRLADLAFPLMLRVVETGLLPSVSTLAIR